MIGYDSSITQIFSNHEQLKNEFYQNISLNEASMDSLQKKVMNLKNELDKTVTTMTSMKDELTQYKNGIQQVRDSIATVLTDVDSLTTKVDNNAADIYGLRSRINALERNNSSKTSDLLYIANDPWGRHGKYLHGAFYLGHKLSKYRKIQIEYYDGHARRMGTIDVPVLNNGTHRMEFSSGDRMHPNRSWYGIFVDYNKNSIQVAHYFTAGNASWSWHSNKWAIVAKSIRGIYK